MRVLILFEFSGTVRDAFSAKGHDAWSLDTKPSATKGNHYQMRLEDFTERDGWDLVIAHPPCTALCVSGNRTYAGSLQRMEAIAFVEKLWFWPAKRMCIENPVGVLSTDSFLGPPTQYIQPWQFGHGETKKTGLWVQNLPKLIPTDIVEGRAYNVHRKLRSSADRSKTYTGIANAMADQWGNL